jgi:UrcA family protein
MTTLKTSFLCAAISAASLTAFSPGAALAGPPRELRSVTVSYADLDLSKQAGVAALYRRIEAAANRVCGSKPAHDVKQIYAQVNCVHNAVANAVADVDVRQLAALHEQQLRFTMRLAQATKR